MILSKAGMFILTKKGEVYEVKVERALAVFSCSSGKTIEEAVLGCWRKAIDIWWAYSTFNLARLLAKTREARAERIVGARAELGYKAVKVFLLSEDPSIDLEVYVRPEYSEFYESATGSYEEGLKRVEEIKSKLYCEKRNVEYYCIRV